jgi:DNA-binding transcriptional ArsR family regulator
MTTLKYFITSKAKRNLLKFFLTDINASYYTREASRLTGEPLNAVRRELGYLEKAGLLRSRMQGNLKYYEVIKSYPLLAEWRKIILETTDVVIAVSRSCEPEARQEAKQSPEPEPVITPPDIVIAGAAKQSIPKQSPETQPGSISTLDSVIDHLSKKFNDLNSITLAIIHGEAARSEKIPADGIELLVVGDINKDVLLEIIAKLEVTTGIGISLMHLTTSGFDYRNAQGDPFIRRIWGEKKLVVKGRH